MGKIVVSENVTLDGVIQDPTGEEGFKFGGWFNHMTDEDRGAWAKIETEEAKNAAALLFGARSYTYFATRWVSRTGEWADALRRLPKYVVSTTLKELDWDNSTRLEGDVVEGVAKLRQSVDGDIVVYGSARLVHTLLEHNLVDEVRLMIYPYALGSGTRLFGETSDMTSLRLVATCTVGTGLTSLTYQRAREV